MHDPFEKPNDDFETSNPYVSPAAEESHGQGYVTPVGEPLDPWFSVWMQPRATIRQIISSDPRRFVVPLAILGGIASSFDAERALEQGGELVQRVGFFGGMLLGGAVGGLVGLFVGGWLIKITGRWLGGVADAVRVRAALGWSNVPSVLLMPFTLLMAGAWVVRGNDFLVMQNSPTVALPWMVYYISLLVLAIWQFVIACRMVGEVHEFSGWRGLGAILVAGLLIFIVVGVPIMLIVFATEAV